MRMATTPLRDACIGVSKDSHGKATQVMGCIEKVSMYMVECDHILLQMVMNSMHS